MAQNGYGGASYGGGYGGASYGGGGRASYGGAAPTYSTSGANGAYPSYGYNAQQGGGMGGSSSNGNGAAGGPTLRRRAPAGGDRPSASASSSSGGSSSSVVKKLDFMFPKVDSEFKVQTERGGMATMVAFVIIAVLCLAELSAWVAQNRSTTEHISVSTSLGKRMRINMNITFPALACEDLHVDAMDVAGDSQLDVDDTLVKKSLRLDGTPRSQEEIKVETNAHHAEQKKKEEILKQKLKDDYCGPCFGAQEQDDQCCQTCDELIEAYKKKRWKTSVLIYTAEQCIREGRDRKEPKRMTKGQGCNLSGYMTVNRVAGNFHIAMGEGIERDGRHIHTFLPEDAPNFNASHTIHELTFGPGDDSGGAMNNMKKIVAHEHGTTGLFQYFIKVVPTTYVGKDMIARVGADQSAQALPSLFEEVEDKGSQTKDVLETNRYFFTERFRPLMKEFLKDEHAEEDDPKKAGVEAGHKASQNKHKQHSVQNSVLPGVFFIYEIYPFAVEVSTVSVPFTHLLIRLMATIGGVFTVVSWMEAAFRTGGKDRQRGKR